MTLDGEFDYIDDSGYRPSEQNARRAQAHALATEIENQLKALTQARSELETLRRLVSRPGLPVVYDTNMFDHWRQPSDIKWREVFRAQDEDVSLTRLVVPLRVIDELDRQKYGQGDLAQRAATAIQLLGAHPQGRLRWTASTAT